VNQSLFREREAGSRNLPVFFVSSVFVSSVRARWRTPTESTCTLGMLPAFMMLIANSRISRRMGVAQ
jgi:hypothetical protein